MKKYIKITEVLILFALCFTACGIPALETPSTPGVEIVERSRLMDEITVDVIMPREKRRILGNAGFEISCDNFRMTSDNSGEIDLTLKSKKGSYTTRMEGFLSYERTTHMGKDVFENIQFYWGDIRTDSAGENALITGVKKVERVNFSQGVSTAITLPLPEEIKGPDGIVLKANLNKQNGCSVVYHCDGKDYLWLGDENGAFVQNVALPVAKNSLVTINTENVIPIDTAHKPVISYMGLNTLVTGVNAAYYYNRSAGTLLYGDPVTTLDNRRDNIVFYKMQRNREGKERHRSDFYLAVKTRKENVESVFIAPALLGDSRLDKNIVVSDYGYSLVCPGTGMVADLNFEKGSIAALRYNINSESLGDKLYISTDKAKAIYSYAPELWNNVQTYNIALSEENGANISYIACAGLINNAYPGETGFLSTDEIYVLGCDDYRIYTDSGENVNRTFALSDKFPLGENIDSSLTDRVLVCAGRNEKTKEFVAVYYDTSYENPQYLKEGDIRLAATYQLAFFDNRGNLVKTVDTGINAFTGYNPVNLAGKRKEITITVTSRDTDKLLVKAEYDISKEKINIIQDYADK